jgi:hypothetical protein
LDLLTMGANAVIHQRLAALGAVPDVEPELVEGELAEELTVEQAEALTTRIQSCIKLWHRFEAQATEMVLKAYHGQAFKTLGYESWQAYASARFGDLEMPRSTQAAINAALVNRGQISARSAAAVTGTDHKTAARDAAKAQRATGEPSPVDSEPRTGADGKKRRAVRKPRQRPPDPPDVNVFAGRIAIASQRLLSEDDIGKQLQELAPYQDKLAPVVSEDLAIALEAVSARALQFAAIFRGVAETRAVR